MSGTFDDRFASFVKKARETQGSSPVFTDSGSNSADYEQIQWAGLQQGEWRIVRVVSSTPASLTGSDYKVAPTDAVELYFTEIKDDNGKKMQLKLPIPGDLPSKDHVLWRVIRKVLETTYVDKKRVAKWENDPNTSKIFKKVSKGGWDPVSEQNQFKYSKGWQGQRIIVMNVIDRENMEWHREHKHTMLLSRNVDVRQMDDGTVRTYPAQGVPSFGFLNLLVDHAENYGDWTTYDLAIKRTGVKNSPYQINNASVYKQHGIPEVPKAKLDKAVIGDLTDEEKSWERYDISKLFAPTSFTKLKKRLGTTIKEIDAVFGTQFYDEIVAGAAKEEAEFEEKKNSAEGTANTGVKPPVAETTETQHLVEKVETVPTTAEITPTVAEVTPVASNQTVGGESTLSASDIALLKGWEHLTPEQKAQVIKVEADFDGKVTHVEYAPGHSGVVACEYCGAPGLREHTHCIGCGVEFE